jgi:hypothetical protein
MWQGTKSAGLKFVAEYFTDDNSNYNYYYYGSADRNRAMVLETLLLLGQKQKHLQWQQIGQRYVK